MPFATRRVKAQKVLPPVDNNIALLTRLESFILHISRLSPLVSLDSYSLVPKPTVE